MSSTYDLGERRNSSDRIAVATALFGLAVVLLIRSLNGALLLNEEESSMTTVGAIAFIATFTMPFVLTLSTGLGFARRLKRSIWMAAGLCSLLLGGFTIFSVIGILFFIVAYGLFLAWWSSKPDNGYVFRWTAVIATSWIVGWVGLAVFALHSRDTPRCWTESGWSESASWSGSTVIDNGRSITCSTDITDTREGSLSLVSLGIALGGTSVLMRRK